MLRGILTGLALLAAMPAIAQTTPQPMSVSLDVAPTSLSLAPGKAGLLYITNHGARAVTVQVEATDWRQENGRDVLTPSDTLFVSPPLAHIAAGARQTVRIMARTPGTDEKPYRLVISQLPDAAADAGAVTVLLEFRLPVFVGGTRAAPLLAWSAHRDGAAVKFSVRNEGRATVKLTGLKAGGAALADTLVYVLPGAVHDFAPLAITGALHLTGADGLSGQAIVADFQPEP